jgi:hypothetical protein
LETAVKMVLTPCMQVLTYKTALLARLFNIKGLITERDGLIERWREREIHCQLKKKQRERLKISFCFFFQPG